MPDHNAEYLWKADRIGWPEKSARGLAHSKTLARTTVGPVSAKRLGVRRPSAAFRGTSVVDFAAGLSRQNVSAKSHSYFLISED
jgi:hypothetical protein